MKILNTILSIGLFMNTAYSAPLWSSLNNFGGGVRFGAAVFVINGLGYVGTGNKGTTNINIAADDFWRFDPTTGTWTSIASFGGGAKINQVAFVIANEGYVGVGNNSPELWKYTPTSNMWTKMTSLPFNPQYQGTAFAIGAKGYFRDGESATMLAKTSFWEYDPAVGVGGTWTQKKDLESGMNGIVLRGSAGFAINGKGYIGAGLDGGSQNIKDFYEYTPGPGLNGGSWTQVAPIGGSTRINTVSFATSTKGYVGLGYHAMSEPEFKEIWVFDPTVGSPLGTWSKLPLDFPDTKRSQAVGFAVGQNLYIGTGNYTFEDPGYSDFWQYSPTGESVLPVELTTINATADLPHEHVDVNWQTATEQQTAYFVIERQSKTSNQFEEIGRIKGAGNSAKTLTYKFIDEKPKYGISYYRLRLVDTDSKTTYSKAVSVSYKGGAKIKVFPTYTDGYITIENSDTPVDGVYVWNTAGQLMLQAKQTQLDLFNLPSGMYLVQVKAGSETFVQKVTKM